MRWYDMLARFTIESQKKVPNSKFKTLHDYMKTVAEMVGLKVIKAEEVNDG